MPRPAGARNHDFEEKRAALVDALTNFALHADLRRPSLRQFAIAAGASEPTLRHYFGDRRGVVTAILENLGHRGDHFWSVIATPADNPLTAVEQYYRITEAGMRHGGFVRAHAFGLIEGIADEIAGKAYLENILEPAMSCIMEKLRGTPGAPQAEKALRAAALAMMAPLLVLCLHQDLLGGAEVAPIDAPNTVGYLQVWLGNVLSS